MNGLKRATLNDVAAALGLSANTVSRALADRDGVSARTRELVLREAGQLGYIAPNARSRAVALTVTSSTNFFIQQLIPAVESSLRSLGYTVVLRITEESPEVEAEAISAMSAAKYAGALVIPVQGVTTSWDAIVEARLPVVAISRDIQVLGCDFVALDNRAALYAATRHLLTGGGRSLLYFDEDLEIATIHDRIGGFEDAIETFSGATGTVVRIPTRRFESRTVPWQPEEAYRRVLGILDQGANFDSMLFADDYYALGALRALQERGLQVPRDVRVVGFGDHPYSRFLTPSLTSVRVPARVIAEAAVALLVQRIAGNTSATVRRLVSAELIVRESSVMPSRLS